MGQLDVIFIFLILGRVFELDERLASSRGRGRHRGDVQLRRQGRGWGAQLRGVPNHDQAPAATATNKTQLKGFLIWTAMDVYLPEK